jgi:hypothetical protein
MLAVAEMQMEQLRQEAIELKKVCEIAREACRKNLTHASVKDEQVLFEAFKLLDAAVNP